MSFIAVDKPNKPQTPPRHMPEPLIPIFSEKDVEYLYASLRQEYPKGGNVFFTRKCIKPVKWCE